MRGWRETVVAAPVVKGAGALGHTQAFGRIGVNLHGRTELMDTLQLYSQLSEVWEGKNREDRRKLDELSVTSDFGTLADLAAFMTRHADETESPYQMAEAYLDAALKSEAYLARLKAIGAKAHLGKPGLHNVRGGKAP